MYNYTPHYLSFTHGNVSYGAYVDALEVIVDSNNTSVGTTFGIVTQCNFVFDKYYTGTVTMNYSYSSSDIERNINFWTILVNGGKIDSINNTSGKITFRVYDRNEFTVYMYYETQPLLAIPSNDPAFDFTSASSSLTAVTDHNEVYDNIDSIDAKLSTINTNLVNIISDTNTINQYCGDLLSELYDVNSALDMFSDGVINTDIEDQISTLITNTSNTNTSVSNVTTSINSLRAYLFTTLGTIDVQNPSPTIIQCVNTMSTTMTNIYNDVQTLKNDVASIKSSLTTIGTTLGNLLNLVANIDNTIDTITWQTYNGFSYYGVSTDIDGTFDYPTSTITYPTNSHIYIKYLLRGVTTDNILHCVKIPLQIASTTGRYTPDFNVDVYTASNPHRKVEIRYMYYNVSSDNVYLYFNLVNSNVTNLILDVSSTGSDNRFYIKANATTSYRYISSEDIEFWKLLSYFEQVKADDYNVGFNNSLIDILNDIIDAINNVNVTVNVTENEITNITNDFDFDIDIINNIQNNISLDFNSYNNSVSDADLTFDLTPYSDTIVLYKTNITSLWASPLVSVPTILSVIVFVFLVILG